MRYIYIAAPYSSGDTIVNTRNAMLAWDELFSHGFIPMCPHWTMLQHFLTPHEYEDWLAFDFAWIRKCDAILRLPGESSGADREVALARDLGIPVFHSIEDLVRNDAA